jgi:hypothetical protein
MADLRVATTRAAMIAAIVAVAVTAWTALGPAGSLALASTWMLGAGIARAIPSLRGAASWAAGILMEFALVLGASGIVALASPHLHSRAVDLGILALPAVVGAALLMLSSRTRNSNIHGRAPSWWGVPLSINVWVLAIATWVSTTGPYHGIAWAMSGDARNHVGIVRSILYDGGLTLERLKTYPAGVNAFAAVLAGAGPREGATDLAMLTDIHAMATTYLLAVIAIAVLIAGALTAILPSTTGSNGWPPVAIVITLLTASAVAGSPFVLGMALTDGFFSGYGALPASLAGVVLALRFFTKARSEAPLTGAVILAFVTLSTFLTFMSWTVLVVVPAALSAVILVSLAKRLWVARRDARPLRDRAALFASWVVICGACIAMLVLARVIEVALPRLMLALVSPGSSRAPYTLMLVVLCLVALGTALFVNRSTACRQLYVPVIAAAAGIATLFWLVRLPGPGMTWTYYAQKTNWLVSANLIWVPFAPIVLWLSGDGDPVTRKSRASGLSAWFGALSSAVAVLMLFSSATTAPGVLLEAARGWNQPSATVVTEAIRVANTGEPTVFWDWSDPGNDRLGNFWGVLAWASTPSGEFTTLPGVPGGFSYWSYMEMGQLSDLCTLAGGAPGITVRTHNEDLSDDLRQACPTATATVVVEP